MIISKTPMRLSFVGGGKLLGAGGGGFMVFSAPKERHSDIKKALSSLRHVDFGFENMGTSIVFYQ